MVLHGLWRALRVALGATLFGVGMVGLFLPFLQGILLMVIGLTLLSRESRRAKQVLSWLRVRVGLGPKRPAGPAMQQEGADDAG